MCDFVSCFYFGADNYGFDFCLWFWGMGWQQLVWRWSLFVVLGLATRRVKLIGNFLVNYRQQLVWIIILFFGFVSNICLRVGNDGCTFLSLILSTSTSPNNSLDDINLSKSFWHGDFDFKMSTMVGLCFGVVNNGFDIALHFLYSLYRPYPYPSNFELIDLAYESPMDDEICWFVSQYCFDVYEEEKMRAQNYTIDVDKLRKHLIEPYIPF